MVCMRIVVLAGGIGGARFLLGVRAWARHHGATVTAVVNVGDDVTLHGLRICPDLDSVMYTLGGGADPERGWGRVGETWTVKDELAAYGAEPTWFGLGDQDVATHLVRTRMLDAGLSAVRGDRGAVRPLAARCPAAAGHRRPAGDARRGRRARRRRKGHPLPGMVGPAPWRAAGAPLRLRRGRGGQAGAGRAGRAGRGRRGAGGAEQPGGEHRADPGRAGPADGGHDRPAAGGRRLPDHRRSAGARHGRPVPGRDRRRVQRGRGRRALRRARRRRAARRLAGRPGRRRRGHPGPARPRDSTVDDRRGGDGGDGGRRPGRRPGGGRPA